MPLYEAEAKERQRASGGDKKSEDAKSVVAKIPQPIEGKARQQAAHAFHTNGRYVSDAMGTATMPSDAFESFMAETQAAKTRQNKFA